jgi:hypothetical protein
MPRMFGSDWESFSLLCAGRPRDGMSISLVSALLISSVTTEQGLLLQGWISGKYPAVSSSAFRVRRAELFLKVNFDGFGFGISADPSKVLEYRQDEMATNELSLLQDVYLSYSTEYADISVGQFKIPISSEGLASSSKLLLPERALVARRYGDKRDLGVRIAKKTTRFAYSLGLFNGAGANRVTSHPTKDLGARIEWYPIPQLTIGASGYASVFNRDAAGAKDRIGFDFKTDHGGYILQAEYITARDVGSTASLRSHGFYLAGAATVLGVFQPVVRVGHVDPDLAADAIPKDDNGDDEVWHFEGGLAYLAGAAMRFQGSFSYFAYDQRKDAFEMILATQLTY